MAAVLFVTFCGLVALGVFTNFFELATDILVAWAKAFGSRRGKRP